MNCPACSNPLVSYIELQPGGESQHVLYCKHGSDCPSPGAMNNGATGATEQEAFDKLEAAWEDEAMQLELKAERRS